MCLRISKRVTLGFVSIRTQFRERSDVRCAGKSFDKVGSFGRCHGGLPNIPSGPDSDKFFDDLG